MKNEHVQEPPLWLGNAQMKTIFPALRPPTKSKARSNMAAAFVGKAVFIRLGEAEEEEENTGNVAIV